MSQDPLHPPPSINLTVLTPSQASALIDVAAVRGAVEGLESVPDTVLTTRIVGATAGISRFFGVQTSIGAKLLRQEYVEKFGGGGGVILRLNRWPVESQGLLVEVEGQALDASEFELQVASGRIRRAAGWRSGATVTYWGGWGLDGQGYQLPDEVTAAALITVELHLRPAGIVELGETHYREPEGDLTYLPPEATALLSGLGSEGGK